MGKYIVVLILSLIGSLPLACSIDHPVPSAPQTVATSTYTPTTTPTTTTTPTPTSIYTMIPVTIVANSQYPTTSEPSYSAILLWGSCPGGTGLCLSGSVSLGLSSNYQATTVVSIPQGQFTYIQVNEAYSLPVNYTFGNTLELIVTQPNVSPVTSYGSPVTSGSDVADDADIDTNVGSSASSVK